VRFQFVAERRNSILGDSNRRQVKKGFLNRIYEPVKRFLMTTIVENLMKPLPSLENGKGYAKGINRSLAGSRGQAFDYNYFFFIDKHQNCYVKNSK
jgi:hypothetical protein